VTEEIVLRVFGIMNFLLFSAVVITVIKYHHGTSD
jgi:hypothetical protein